MNESNACGVCKKVYQTEQDYLTNTNRWRICSRGHLWFNCGCGSTLMIPKGKFDWYSPDMFLEAEAKGIFNKLGNLKDLPHFPTSVMELQQLLSQPDITPQRLVKSLRHEPVIATQLLQIAENIRNARNPGNQPITSLEHAVVYIGNKQLSDLVMMSAFKMMPMPKSDFDANLFWRNSYLTGSVAEYIMRKFKIELNADEVFLAASLCNVGKLVTAFCFPPLVTKIWRDVHDVSTLMTWRQAEDAYKFPDHCVLGEIASTIWGFPEYLMRAARHHHTPPQSKAMKPRLNLVELVAFANQMTHWINLEPHRMEYPVVTAAAEKLMLGDLAMDQLAMELTHLKSKIRDDTVTTPA